MERKTLLVTLISAGFELDCESPPYCCPVPSITMQECLLPYLSFGKIIENKVI